MATGKSSSRQPQAAKLRLAKKVGKVNLKWAQKACARETQKVNVRRPDGTFTFVRLSQRIQYVKPNPKRQGSMAAKRYSRYMRARTVGEALKLGSCVGDIKFDYSRQYMRRKYASRNTRKALSRGSAFAIIFNGEARMVPLAQKIRYAENPKVAGSMAHERYNRYCSATTLNEALQLGACMGDVNFDVANGFATFPRLCVQTLPRLQSHDEDRWHVRSRLPRLRQRAKRLSLALESKAIKEHKKLLEAVADKKNGAPSSAASSHEPSRSTSASVAPHALVGSPADYKVVILSYPHAARIQILRDQTLAFLEKQGVPLDRISLVVASRTERSRFADSLGARSPRILVAERGIVKAREWIVQHFPEGTHIVSMDDDVKDVAWKTGSGNRRTLPSGGFDRLVRHADAVMRAQGAYLWSLNPSKNMLNMRDIISRKAGLANGHFYGFINRPFCTALQVRLGEAAEDCERSVRYFAQDKVILRYMMYHAETEAYLNPGGLQTIFGSGAERKEAEISHIEKLQKAFPGQVQLNAKEMMQTVNISFTVIGLPPLRPHPARGWV